MHDLYIQLKMKPNLSQNTAISLLCCFDGHIEKIDRLASDASAIFDVEVEKNLTLLTIRHYDQITIDNMTKEKQIVLEQKTPETIQVLMK